MTHDDIARRAYDREMTSPDAPHRLLVCYRTTSGTPRSVLLLSPSLPRIGEEIVLPRVRGTRLVRSIVQANNGDYVVAAALRAPT